MADISLSSPPSSPPPCAQRMRSITPSDIYEAVTGDASFTSVGTDNPGPAVGGSTLAGVCNCVCGKKRPAEAMDQYVEAAARNLKLKPANKKQLVNFSRASTPEREIILTAHLIKCLEKQEELAMPDLIFTIPDGVKSYIHKITFIAMVSPSAAAYVDKGGPLKCLMEKVETKYNTLVRNDTAKKVVMKYLQERLTDRRYTIKNEIVNSRGNEDPEHADKRVGALDVITLCEKVLKLYGPAKMKVSVEMVGRFALLRRVSIKGDLKKYWNNVDIELDKIRATHQQPGRIARVIKKVLDEDLKLYGTIDTSELPASIDVNEAEHDDDK